MDATKPRPERHIISASVLPTTLLLCAPVACVFLVLVLAGALSWLAAVLGALACFAALLILTRIGMRNLAMVGTAIETPEDPGTLHPAFAPAAALITKARAQHRVVRGREEELRQDLESLRYMFDEAPAPLMLLDENRQVVLANPASERLIGRAPATGPLYNVLRDPDLLDAVDRVLDGGQDSSVEFDLHGPPPRALKAVVRPVAQGEGTADWAMLMIEDLTVHKRMHRMRADFVANASHELRTPLSTLSGYIETLSGPAGAEAPTRVRFLEIMAAQAARMARLIDDLMSLSQLEAADNELPGEAVDLRRLVQEQVEAQQIVAGERGMHFRIEVLEPDGGAEADDFVIVAHRDQIIQVIQNLLDNAIKYGHEDSAIRVEVERRDAPSASRSRPAAALVPLPTDGSPGVGSRGQSQGPDRDRDQDHVRLSVIDQGDGIAPEHLERLTERFYRVDLGRSRAMGGTGLGLAIVKHIVGRHGGQLAIESTLGQGSRFTVTLPAFQPAGMSEVTLRAAQ